MAQRHFFFLACLLSTGCIGKSDDSGDSGADTDTGTDTDTNYSPTEGVWLATNFTVDSDECNLGFLVGLAEDARFWWELDSTDDGWNFTAANGLVAACTQSSNDVECLASSVFDYTEGGEVANIPIPPTDAIVTLDATSTGTLTSDSTSTVATIWEGDCEGTECEALLSAAGVTSPCTTVASSLDFTLEDFGPTEGTWAQSGFAWDEDGCNAATNLGLSGLPAIDVAMVDNEDGTFAATDASSGLTYNCTFDGLNFACESTPFIPHEDVSISIDATGRFGNEKFYTAQFNMVAECSGDDCDATSETWGVDFPCTSTGSTFAGFSE